MQLDFFEADAETVEDDDDDDDDDAYLPFSHVSGLHETAPDSSW